jgi:hypothetical protein
MCQCPWNLGLEIWILDFGLLLPFPCLPPTPILRSFTIADKEGEPYPNLRFKFT